MDDFLEQIRKTFLDQLDNIVFNEKNNNYNIDNVLPKCTNCNSAILDIIVNGPGCPTCYSEFSYIHLKKIPNIPNKEKIHIGKVPKIRSGEMITFDNVKVKLETRMNKAAIIEDYTVAAQVRDKKKEISTRIINLVDNSECFGKKELEELKQEIVSDVKRFLDDLDS